MARVLVVEDDLLQQEVLKAALEKRGYEIEIAGDGLSAIRKLRAGGYDLALMDYHLPEVDGFASARLLHDMMPGGDRPKLIAMTGAADELSRRDGNRTVFDEIVQKPLALPDLLSMVDRQLRGAASGQAASAAVEAWGAIGRSVMPSAIAIPEPDPVQARLLRCYFDLSGRNPPDAVLLISPGAEDAAVASRARSPWFALPFIDLTGSYRGADAVFSGANKDTWRATAAAIEQFAAGRRLLSAETLNAVDIETRLLVYLFLSARPLRAALDPAHADCARYPGFFPAGEVRMAAEHLAGQGALRREFVERFHVCGGCGSSRLNAREECPSCQSAHLAEAALVHHFRCAWQAPEADFVNGPNLICPKCRQHLRHYGSDYDKPGTATVCGACGRSSPEPAVGFLCLDCGGRTAGDAAAKRDVFSYTLTGEGQAMLRRGRARIASEMGLAAGALPVAIQQALARSGPTTVLAVLEYGAKDRIVARRGQTGYMAMRRLFIENMVNALEVDCTADAGQDADHLLIHGDPAAIAAELTPAFLDDCQEMLAEGLEPRLRFHASAPDTARA